MVNYLTFTASTNTSGAIETQTMAQQGVSVYFPMCLRPTCGWVISSWIILQWMPDREILHRFWAYGRNEHVIVQLSIIYLEMITTFRSANLFTSDCQSMPMVEMVFVICCYSLVLNTSGHEAMAVCLLYSKISPWCWMDLFQACVAQVFVWQCRSQIQELLCGQADWKKRWFFSLIQL